MSLREYVVPKEDIEIPGSGSFHVRGLSLEDLSPLLTAYRPQLLEIWNKIEAYKEGKSLGEVDLSECVQIALAICPPIVSGLIAIGSDEPDEITQAAKLPISVQVFAIEALVRMTFEQNGGSAKLWEAVIKMIKGVAVLAKPQIATLKNQNYRH